MPEARPWSPVEIEERMRSAIERLEDAVNLQKVLGEAAANKRSDYKFNDAKLTLQAKLDPNLKTDMLRKAWVYTQTYELDLAAEIADAHHDAQRSVVRSLQSEMEVLRSLARSHRDMTDSGGYGHRS